MFKYIFFISIFLISNFALANDELVSFETDNCTGYVEGTRADPNAWKMCCVEHDMFFWAGGSSVDRKNADNTLRQCVTDSGHPRHAALIYYSVRLGSYSPIKFSGKKWNFGWPNRPIHQALTTADIDKIEEHLFTSYPTISLEFKQDFVLKLRSR